MFRTGRHSKELTRDEHIRYKTRLQKCSRIKNKDSLKFQISKCFCKYIIKRLKLGLDEVGFVSVKYLMKIQKKSVLINFDEIHVQYQ